MCRHAEGLPVDYAAEAVRQGLSVLGFSDHTPFPDNRWIDVRMAMSDLPAYIESVQQARLIYPELTILTGLECEYIPEYHHFYQDELLGCHHLDYLICGQHWFLHHGQWLGSFGQSNTPERLGAYTDHVIEAMGTGLFDFVAHPDIFGNDYLIWDANAITCTKALAEAAAELGIPLEINGLGFRRETIQTPDGERRMYPWTPFWETASAYPITVTINSDAHRPADIVANIPDAMALARRFNLHTIELFDRIAKPTRSVHRV